MKTFLYQRLIVLLMLFVVTNTFAQQRPYYTQYILNNYIINPAVAGIENYTDIKVSHRAQWVGLQGAPVTTYLTIHAPLKKSDYDERQNPTSFHREGGNPRGQAYWQSYQKPEPHHGVGFTILNDKTGPLNRFAAYGSYAYHVGLSSNANLSFGISAGITQMSIDNSKVDFGNTNVDPAVNLSSSLNTIKPDISAGLWLYSKNYFAGISVQQIVPQNIVFSGTAVQVDNGRLVPHIFFQAGMRLYLSDDLTLLPSVMARYINPLPLGVDINAKLQYQDLIWVGGTYRYQDGFAGMLGVNLSNSINIGYSYDINTSNLRAVSNGSHEILVGFLLGNKYGDWCPKNLF
jgi:type IX secretion system PorP/SprF family membrane protein